MKVPYAKKWQKETDKRRQIALDCDLTEELKWGKPCFTFLNFATEEDISALERVCAEHSAVYGRELAQ